MKENWTNDHREWYRTVYLHSEHWKSLRGRKLESQPGCEHCGSKARDVHHVNYRHVLNVKLGDLLSLCRPCHEEIHRVEGMPRRTKPRNIPVTRREGVALRQAIRAKGEAEKARKLQESKDRKKREKAAYLAYCRQDTCTASPG